MAESNPTQVILTDDGIKIIKSQNTADKAVGLASANATGIKNINDPNYLSPFEKPQLEIQMDNFATIYSADKSIATSEGIDFSAYEAAYQAYVAYMTPLVADMTTYSPIVRSTFNSMVTAAQAEQKRFNAATQAQYSQQINKAKTDIANGQTKYEALQSEAKIMKSSVAGIADAADRAISNAGFASNTASEASKTASTASRAASSALASAMSAESNASSAVSTANSTAAAFGPVKQSADSALIAASSAVSIANSTASGFGKVSQKADSAFSNAMSAESSASSAVSQALSAASDSKDAKQIAGAVSQSYKILTDGSTMTIAELESGLAVKLTKADLNGYATQDWSQNQIKMTADGINGTISSIKGTVDSHTTSINDLQVDSSSFKSQFMTVNDTIGKHTSDIGSLQVSSKELSSNFSSLDSDNKTNQHNIGELQQSSKDFSSTLLTVQTQVQNSAVGTNLLLGTSNEQEYTMSGSGWVLGSQSSNGGSRSIPATPGVSYTYSALIKSTTYDCYPEIQFFDSSKNLITNSANVLGKDIGMRKTTAVAPENAAFVRVHMVLSNPLDSQTVVFNSEKLEKGSLATDWCANPADNATVTAFSNLSQTVDGMQTDISKKIEQKDLNGYATETWSQNQIKMTADGINGTISSIKGTVDSHTTSINDLQVDSSSFKSQFMTVNDTIGKHTSDIGSLQVSSKELSSNFSSLDSDNKTNQHNIGELQQSSKDFSSTLLTVQTQVQNSAVGTNLLLGTSNEQEYTMSGSGWVLGSQSSNGGSRSIPATPGVSYTYSALIKSTTYDCYPEIQFFDSSKNLITNSANVLGKDIGMRKSTAVAPENTAFVGAHMVLNIPKDSQTVVFNSEKLEKGSLATDWCANPADNATVTALTQVKQTADSAQLIATNNQGDIAKLQVTANGLQSTVSDKVSSDQLTQLGDQLTNKISDLSSSTSSKFTQTSNDINAMVKKGDVVNQFNLDAGGALLSTSGNSTKIVFSSPNIIFDSANPVQILNANIPGTLTGKTIDAGTITANTNIKGSDIEAPLIHSPSGSFKLYGNTGDIIGASIHSADSSWGIDKNGNISGVDIKIGGTYSYVGTGSSQVITGAIYNELDSAGYHQWTDANDHVRINNGTIGITNDEHEKANIDGVHGIPLGVLISDGQSQLTGNVSITNNLQVGNFYTNGGHTINSMDGGAVFLENGVSSGNSMVDFHAGTVFATGLQTNNLGLNSGHTLSSADGGGIYVKDTYNGGGNMVDLHVKKLYESSLLSLKTDIKPIDPHEALTEVVKNDVMGYHFKNDKTTDPKSVSVILDDINPIPKYYTSDIFKSADGTGRNDGTIVGYLMLSIKDLNSRLQKLEGAN